MTALATPPTTENQETSPKASVGAAVKQVFGGVDQDIEWATVGGRIALLQERPYVDRSTAPARP